jgi:hypothetical protein
MEVYLQWGAATLASMGVAGLATAPAAGSPSQRRMSGPGRLDPTARTR